MSLKHFWAWVIVGAPKPKDVLMKFSVGCVIFLFISLFVLLPEPAISAPSEHFKYTPYPSREEVRESNLSIKAEFRASHDNLLKMILSLKNDYIEHWMRWLNVVIPLLGLTFAGVGFVGAMQIYGMRKEARDTLEKIERYLDMSRNITTEMSQLRDAAEEKMKVMIAGIQQ